MDWNVQNHTGQRIHALSSCVLPIQQALRALEPTFQLASYSNRCYRKATLLFDATRESTGRNLKQFGSKHIGSSSKRCTCIFKHKYHDYILNQVKSKF